MAKSFFQSYGLVLVAAASALAATFPAAADKPAWAGGHREQMQHGERGPDWKDHPGKGHKNKNKNKNYGGRDWDDGRGRRHPQAADFRSPYAGGRYFSDQHRVVIRNYYVDEYRRGRCPPGLAKKHNGCLPPGLAKKWAIGRPLPRDVVYYDVPPAVVMGLGYPPPGYRFVRVASDILMIAVGTGMVMDALTDLGGGW